ncbi:MAG: hypothetical protein N3A58_01885 [Spirochaetes bacterium]|nr:hypothetical protein [Spirochaetota bacterium]
MNNFIDKIKDLNNEVKLILFLFIGSIILWFFNLITGTYFSNLLFSLLFLFIPLISKYIYEILKTNSKFQELNIESSSIKIYLVNLLLSAVLAFFVFVVFSRVAYGPANSFGKAIVFGFYGFLLIALLMISINFIDKFNFLKEHKYLNISINGIIFYFLITLILKLIFDPSLLPGKGFQRLIYLLIESIGSGSVYSLTWYFLNNMETMDDYLERIKKYKIKIEKVEDNNKN